VARSILANKIHLNFYGPRGPPLLNAQRGCTARKSVQN